MWHAQHASEERVCNYIWLHACLMLLDVADASSLCCEVCVTFVQSVCQQKLRATHVDVQVHGTTTVCNKLEEQLGCSQVYHVCIKAVDVKAIANRAECPRPL